ncbi:hypothetical protein DP113_00375 [Brasilonema octagenarum UFV-E1]|uniref:DUF928 domain-containing protein n=1 Tax=Brasilonema sennae CENA114 TaxID=415709 RepID=A0A856MC59_9CYAN|nr:DUF928 domain-containing protein [Brasilonema sennae]QDL06566.1 hypothetical protein DP114_00375 [Brasilonema sennae CENA114]QDL12936.1 hypothetical protein DP113_00375 [Brasilonema octagenarum UFV-E1]
MKMILQPMKLLLAVVLGYLSLLPSTTSAIAQSASQSKPLTTTSSRKQPLRLVLPPLPPGQPPGGRRYGGASRGQCPVAKPGLTALVPLIEQPTSVMNVWGQTTAERPTFWFYTPYAKGSAYPADFVLLDAESNLVYRQDITLPTEPGVMSVSLPTSVSPLTTDKQYRWFLNVYCDSPLGGSLTEHRQKQQSPIYVEGVIQRVNLKAAIVQQINQAQPRQQVAIYASNGIWYEALTTVAQLRQKNPQDVTLEQEWQDLLSSIGLSDFASKPLISN